MSFESEYPTPNFGDYLCKAGIDFVTIVSDDPLDFNALRKFGAKVPTNTRQNLYRFPHLATLHDATPKKLRSLAARCPYA